MAQGGGYQYRLCAADKPLTVRTSLPSFPLVPFAFLATNTLAACASPLLAHDRFLTVS